MKNHNQHNIGAIDQFATGVAREFVPAMGTIFRAFCKEEGVTRPEALAFAIAYMQVLIGGNREKGDCDHRTEDS